MKEDICPYCKKPMTDTDRIGVGGRGVAHEDCEQKARTAESLESGRRKKA